MKKKKCGKCKSIKELKDFYKDRSKNDGLTSRCKSCVKQYTKRYSMEHKSEVAIYHKQYNSSNREQYNLCQRLYSFRNKNKVKARKAAQYAIATGILIRPKTCYICGATAYCQAHHFSYEPEHRLHVTFPCIPCHSQIPKGL